MTAIDTDCVQLVTGAAGGIGTEVKRVLAGLGHRVVGVDLAGSDRDCDVCDAEAVEATFAQVEAAQGAINGVAHVAGELHAGSLLDGDPARLRRMFEVNALGTAAVVSAAGRRMRERNEGAIVVVASNAARVPRVDLGGYGASKSAATMLARSAGLELAPHGVRVNVVHPGSTETPMLRESWRGDEDAARAATLAGDPERFRTGIPLGRIAEPGDIARTIAFLLSPAARHVTMAELVVDGGASL